MQPDEFGFLSHSGTLWSWPGQNPYRWSDPSGRDAIGRFVGTIVGGIIGADVGAVGGAAVGGGTTWETGPGVVVGVTGGALAGTVAGAAVGGYYGGNAGDAIGDALGALAASASDEISRFADRVDEAAGGLFMSKAQHEREGDGTRGKTLEEIREAFKDRLSEGELKKLLQKVEKLRGLRNKQKRDCK